RSWPRRAPRTSRRRAGGDSFIVFVGWAKQAQLAPAHHSSQRRWAGASCACFAHPTRKLDPKRIHIILLEFPMSSTATDVVVIGGGPAGSTVSTLIAQRGHRVKLFERERFPRFHIGESLIPETYWVFQRLKMLDKMKKNHFVKKFSVQFVNAA